MILVWGSPDDEPVERMLDELRERSTDVAHLRDGDLADLAYDITLCDEPTGWVSLAGRKVPVDEIRGIYLRPGEVVGAEAATASMTLLALAASIPAIVVNRPAAGRSNWSKPFQLTLLAESGLRVPDTLVTTDPAAAKEFVGRHGRVVYKSVSGIRSIVSILTPEDFDRLDGVATGAVQLQEWIEGEDVRVHVVGQRWFATSVISDASDYRYAHQCGGHVEMKACEVADELGEQLVALTASLGLLVSGTDLRRGPDGAWWAFEVNPSPGFTYYEDGAGQPIGEAIADLLIGARV